MPCVTWSKAGSKDEVVLPSATPVADRRNMVYGGTLVTAGTGAGVVVAIGGETELGEIHRLMSTVEPMATPLSQKLARFSRTLTVAILTLAAFAFMVRVARGQHPADMFTAAVALAVGAIPEGLPAAVTVTLAIGVRRMARLRAVVRRLPVVETLGSTPSGQHGVTGSRYGPKGTIRTPGPGPQEVQDDGSPTLADAALRWCLLAGGRGLQ